MGDYSESDAWPLLLPAQTSVSLFFFKDLTFYFGFYTSLMQPVRDR